MNDNDDIVQMPSLEEFEQSGTVVGFLTKMLAQVVTRIRALEHKIECIENGGCAWEAPPLMDQGQPLDPVEREQSPYRGGAA